MEDTKKRTITVNLTDEECDALLRKCGTSGLTVGELIESFINDLVDGSRTNGSAERMQANQWFDRCWFGMFPEPTLLRHLLENGYDPEYYIDTLEEKEYLEQEEAPCQEDIADLEAELKNMRADWKPEQEPNMEEEIELIRKWVREKCGLILTN